VPDTASAVFSKAPDMHTHINLILAKKHNGYRNELVRKKNIIVFV